MDAKEVYRRLKFKEQMQKKVKAAEAKIDAAEDVLAALRKSCPHYDSWYEAHGSSGGWDNESHYWYHVECKDCGMTDNIDQTGQVRETKYPNAVKKSKGLY